MAEIWRASNDALDEIIRNAGSNSADITQKYFVDYFIDINHYPKCLEYTYSTQFEKLRQILQID